MYRNFGRLRLLTWELLFHRFQLKLIRESTLQRQSKLSLRNFSGLEVFSSVRLYSNYADAKSREIYAGSCDVRTPLEIEENEVLQVSKEFESENRAQRVQIILKEFSNRSDDDLNEALESFGLSPNEDLVLNVLRRHRSDWRLAYRLFRWVCRHSGNAPGSDAYNEMLDILGKMQCLTDMHQLFDEMSNKKGVDEKSYEIVVNRYAAAHKIQDAIDMFYRRREYGLEVDLAAFQKLLLYLCRHKHVDVAECLFRSKKGDFVHDIKTWNIILNGWCVLGSLRDSKRFWSQIKGSNCEPDRVTYGTFINSLMKSGEINYAMKVFRRMLDKGCTPDVLICNCIIDGLCFKKKKIPEAFEILREMREGDKYCRPNVASYNTMIKHLCQIRRMEKVYELLDEMERKKGDLAPNARTFGYLLKYLKKPEEVLMVRERMERNGCKLTEDICNLLLRMYMKWECEEEVQALWRQMEKEGIGLDRRSYTIMIHGYYDKGMIEESLRYFKEMTSKEMVPEPRTRLLVDAMSNKLKERGADAHLEFTHKRD